MLASFPARMVNQKRTDLGIPNRFSLNSSRFNVHISASTHRPNAGEADRRAIRIFNSIHSTKFSRGPPGSTDALFRLSRTCRGIILLLIRCVLGDYGWRLDWLTENAAGDYIIEIFDVVRRRVPAILLFGHIPVVPVEL